jgi:hypothetical protein
MTRSLRVRRLWRVPQTLVKVREGDHILEVHGQDDFVKKPPAARPAQALAELVCNGARRRSHKVIVEVDRRESRLNLPSAWCLRIRQGVTMMFVFAFTAQSGVMSQRYGSPHVCEDREKRSLSLRQRQEVQALLFAWLCSIHRPCVGTAAQRVGPLDARDHEVCLAEVWGSDL